MNWKGNWTKKLIKGENNLYKKFIKKFTSQKYGVYFKYCIMCDKKVWIIPLGRYNVIIFIII